MKWLKHKIRGMFLDEINAFREMVRDIHEIHHGIFQIQEEIDDLNLGEKQETLVANTKRLNEMLLELKGVVSTARACLSEKKQIDLEVEKCISLLKNAIQNEFNLHGSKYFVISEILNQLQEIKIYMEGKEEKKRKKKIRVISK